MSDCLCVYSIHTHSHSHVTCVRVCVFFSLLYIQVRICKDVVPKTNLDAPDREKMWGDLRGESAVESEFSLISYRDSRTNFTLLLGRRQEVHWRA